MIRDQKYKALVIGGSAGSFPLVSRILSELPSDYNLPILMALHRLKHVKSGFVETLNIKSNIKVVEPRDKESIKRGIAYVAPSNYHMLIEMGYKFSLSTSEMVCHSRPSIDILFESCASIYKEKMLGIILTGANKDGAYGMMKVKQYGGATVVQDPSECFVPTMPESVLKLIEVDQILSIDKIIDLIIRVGK